MEWLKFQLNKINFIAWHSRPSVSQFQTTARASSLQTRLFLSTPDSFPPWCLAYTGTSSCKDLFLFTRWKSIPHLRLLLNATSIMKVSLILQLKWTFYPPPGTEFTSHPKHASYHFLPFWWLCIFLTFSPDWVPHTPELCHNHIFFWV